MENKLKESLKKAGGVAFIASHFGIDPVSVYEWIKRGKVPSDRCPEIEALSKGLVRCEELNSDVKWHVLRKPNTNRKSKSLQEC